MRIGPETSALFRAVATTLCEAPRLEAWAGSAHLATLPVAR